MVIHLLFIQSIIVPSMSSVYAAIRTLSHIFELTPRVSLVFPQRSSPLGRTSRLQDVLVLRRIKPSESVWRSTCARDERNWWYIFSRC